MYKARSLEGNFNKVSRLENALERNPEVLPELLLELDEAINLFNSLNLTNRESFKKYHLKNAYYLSQLLVNRSLSSVSQFLKDIEENKDLIENVLNEFKRFEFLGKIEDEDELIACSLVGFYRTFYLHYFPEFRIQSAQIASTIEEMFSLIALNGNKTKTFYAVKHWILDYQAEDFELDLAEAIKSL